MARARSPRRKTALVLVPLCASGLVMACLEPTQITMAVSTNVPWAEGRAVAIQVGQDPYVTETAAPTTTSVDPWQSVDIGTLVVVPREDDDETSSMRVVMGLGRDPTSCTIASPESCIIARRRLRFLSHTPLSLPIPLYAVCIGVPCDVNSTCNALGQCVPSDVDPNRCTNNQTCLLEGDRLPEAFAPIGSSSSSSASSSSGAPSSSGAASGSSGNPDNGGSSGS